MPANLVAPKYEKREAVKDIGFSIGQGEMYVMPFAFVNYFPAQFLLRKSDMAEYPEYYRRYEY